MQTQYVHGLRGALWRIFHSHKRRFVQFALVGVSGVIINNACLFLLVEMGNFNPLIASIPATEAAILSNFVLNDLWTFRGADSSHTRLQRALRYNFVALGGLVISVVVLSALVNLVGMHYIIANLFAIVAALLWNYGFNVAFTWAKPQAASQHPVRPISAGALPNEPVQLDVVQSYNAPAKAS